ncbi:efflux transporter outer membrane subunit [Sphingomonas sp.]|uniref:efflux transporter outer membrane subunit n=1 Tax=Sphingomonas sp. TaxID=28214 RepID=UPI002D1D9C8E|nr:efflux transporter outer membrane subunit [Sphingomonas sp.]HWK35837.1 efflux transporter outer membrane subunit [Sphingomonas sp.]
MSRSLLILLLSATVPLAGCTVGPDYRPKTADALGVPDAYSVPADAAAREDLTQWWTRFDDPLLQRLVASAATTNLDVAQAITRLRQARESLVQARADLLPGVSGSAGYSRNINIAGGTSRVTLPDGTVTDISRSSNDSFSIGADASYQADLFGGIRRGVESSRATYQASGYNYASVLISTQGEIARNYMLARQAQANLANARAALGIQDENLQIAGWRVQAGLVSSLDQEQARASRAQTAASVPSIEASYNSAVGRLGVLTGQAPGALKAEMEATRPIPRGPDAVGVGIPAEALRQRPDVLAAERNLAAATAQIGVAKAQLYPALRITGSLDTNATALSHIGDVITGGLFAGLSQLIFDAGRARAQVRSSEAAADGALLAYKGTVLAALEDVENAIFALRTAREREREYTVALDAANSTAILSRSQYQAGLTDFTTLNQAESALLSARNGLVQAQADQATALVQLYVALGGGWDSTTIPEAPPRGSPPGAVATGTPPSPPLQDR